MCIYMQVYYDSDVGVTEFGFIINTTIVVVVSFHLAVETLHWVYMDIYSTLHLMGPQTHVTEGKLWSVKTKNGCQQHGIWTGCLHTCI